MGDGWLVALTAAPGHILVQVGKTSGHRLCHVAQLVPRDDVALEVIREGALEETAQGVGTGSGDGTGPAPFLGAWSGDEGVWGQEGLWEAYVSHHPENASPQG